MPQKEIVAMLLAGGQGSRLGVLTRNIAKPAVPFGGKYRIIDFSLSNCNSSGIDTIGVLTQYKPFQLNSYIGIGSAWDLDVSEGGVFVLPPYVGDKGGVWYKGTANAIYQNMDFIEFFNPRYVLVISGDHIYKMDYSLMLDYHKKQKADATIAVLEVPWDEASRFGIMNTDEEGIITKFEEKPPHPKNNLASMGVYIFNWPVLKEYLELDEADPRSENDFGKNVIPRMLMSGLRLAAYKFSGYWKDVGTIESYYSANMDLLAAKPELDIFEEHLRIYSKPPILPPHYVSARSRIKNSLVPDGCMILGEVEHSVLFPGVYIGEGSKVQDSIILPNVRIGAHSLVRGAIIGENTVLGNYSRFGCDSGPLLTPADLIVVADHLHFPDRVEIKKGTTVASWQQEEIKIS